MCKKEGEIPTYLLFAPLLHHQSRIIIRTYGSKFGAGCFWHGFNMLFLFEGRIKKRDTILGFHFNGAHLPLISPLFLLQYIYIYMFLHHLKCTYKKIVYFDSSLKMHFFYSCSNVFAFYINRRDV